MTTNVMLIMILVLLMKSIQKSMNPVKTSLTILVAATAMFFFMMHKTNLIWIPTLMLLLFTGGIIMMFMILSSILPNEKSYKSKMSKIMILTTLIMIWTLKTTENTLNSNIKTFISSGFNFSLMTSLILMYFIFSMMLISAQETPMRTMYCY